MSTTGQQLTDALLWGASALLIAAGVAALGGASPDQAGPVLPAAAPIGLLLARVSDRLARIEQRAVLDVSFQQKAVPEAKARIQRLHQREIEARALSAAVVAGAVAGALLPILVGGSSPIVGVAAAIVLIGTVAVLLWLSARTDTTAAKAVLEAWH